MEIDGDAFESSDEMEFLEHNSSKHLMTNDFITEMKRHYDDNNQVGRRYDNHILPGNHHPGNT